MENLVILGSTGSIGINVLRIVKEHKNNYKICALVAKNNVKKMTEQCLIFKPDYACLTNENSAKKLEYNLRVFKRKTKVLSGEQSIYDLVSQSKIDTVISAMSGFSGLQSTLLALQNKKKVLLASKEILVMCGKLFMDVVHRHGAKLIPIDSEHNAIFQNLPTKIQENLGNVYLEEHGISKIILTCSGGPFLETNLKDLMYITPSQACNHPKWTMGKKISVDSATLMNKGLEYIEAKFLFNAKPKQIEILLHPESVIHGMIEYIDGSVLAQLSLPDIRTSIAFAMSYPNRLSINIKPLNLILLKKLRFKNISKKRYPCFQLAIEASKKQSTSIAINSANEIAVNAFLNKQIRFTDIPIINEQVLNEFSSNEPKNIEEVLLLSKQAKKIATKKIKKLL